MSEKKFRFNLVDFVVIAALIAVVAFVGMKLAGAKIASQNTATYQMTFYTDESTFYSLENVKEGDLVCDEFNDQPLGKVIKIDISDKSCASIETADGKFVEAAKPGYGSGKITFEGVGLNYDYGSQFGECKYSVGQTVTLKMGTSKLYGRIYSIQKIA